MLYIVATPIGNLGDFSTRAIEILQTVDHIICEDTRVTQKLKQRFQFTANLFSLHKYNEATQIQELVTQLQSGKKLALVSDAGTPMISDPGARLVAASHASGIKVIPIPGASAVSTALSAAGFDLEAHGYYFAGFLPAKASARRTQLKQLATYAAVTVYFEAPHRILATLQDFVDIFGGQREVVFCRELTKAFETIRRTSLQELLDLVQKDPNQQRGEIVLVLAGQAIIKPIDVEIPELALQLAQELQQHLSLKTTCQIISSVMGLSKNKLYKIVTYRE